MKIACQSFFWSLMGLQNSNFFLTNIKLFGSVKLWTCKLNIMWAWSWASWHRNQLVPVFLQQKNRRKEPIRKLPTQIVHSLHSFRFQFLHVISSSNDSTSMSTNDYPPNQNFILRREWELIIIISHMCSP